MNKKFKEKTREALSSVLPISVIVFLLSIFIVQMPISTIMMFFFGAIMLTAGMGVFSLGIDVALQPLGEDVGTSVTKNKNILILLVIVFFIGFVVTAAEPDLAVLANQVPSIDNAVLILTVAAGVGLLLLLSVLRLIFNVKLSYMLIFFYTLIFILSFFTPKNFLAVAFDSGGVTTGPITVPFIMSFGYGLTQLFSRDGSQDDSFGFIALCSAGPIIAVMLLGILYNPQNTQYTRVVLPNVETMGDVAAEFANDMPEYTREVILATLPIIALFLLFQLMTRRYKKMRMGRMFIGFFYIFIGLVLFFTGVNVGFIPVGNLLGAELGGGGAKKWLLVPIGMLIGFFIVDAEPAVHVLNKQVEEVSGGAIPQKAMRWSLSLGVAVSLGLSMLRILTGMSIYYLLIPGYSLALGLSFFVPKIFTGIAFDSGGVASGPMTSTFILPFAMGACEAVGHDVLTDAFGVVAMVAMTPLIAIQVLGLVYKLKTRGAVPEPDFIDQFDEIIDFDDGSAINDGADFAAAWHKPHNLYDDDRR